MSIDSNMYVSCQPAGSPVGGRYDMDDCCAADQMRERSERDSEVLAHWFICVRVGGCWVSFGIHSSRWYRVGSGGAGVYND